MERNQTFLNQKNVAEYQLRFLIYFIQLPEHSVLQASLKQLPDEQFS
jgi:hypothetical protein